MNFIPSLTTAGFAIAGLAFALGPIIFHLLNRRRYRVVRWAAMDFLREALQRNRRVVEMRDIALLILRTLAVLLVGLALAQPYVAPDSLLMWMLVFPLVVIGLLLAIVAVALWSRWLVRFGFLGGSILSFVAAAALFSYFFAGAQEDKQQHNGSDPLHAVVIIDNSMSMAYESLDGNLLGRAKGRAAQYIERLPEGSYVTVVPLCGTEASISRDALIKDDALEALKQIEVVQRTASLQAAANVAQTASQAGPRDLATRIVYFSDQQLRNWQGLSRREQFDDLPEMQVVDVSSDQRDNTWIADLRIEDGLADVETPTTFVVEVRHEGSAARRNVQVTLTIDGIEVASKSVTLEPSFGAREVRFEHTFATQQVEPGRPVNVPVKATLTSDRLTADDERHLVAHVVAALPVVFVDQYSDEQEQRQENRYGETKTLRRLLAPVTSRSDSSRQLIKIQHLTIDQLDQAVLENARLVVIAGITDPGSAVPLLREYVKQGGQLVIAAGAEFDPQAWSSAAWLDGGGILPLPLRAEPIGALPDAAGNQLKPFFLSYDSLTSHYYFQLADTSDDELRELYAETYFFKAVQVDDSQQVFETLEQLETNRLADEINLLAESADSDDEYAARESRGQLGESDKRNRDEMQRRLSELRPAWLKWGQESDPFNIPVDPAEREQFLEDLVRQSRPRVLARFDNGQPYMVERRIGDGTVIFASSGLRSSWNTMHLVNTFLVYDRILRSMIQSTLPQRNFLAQERFSLPLSARDRQVALALWRPGHEEPEMLDVGFIGKEQRGFTIDKPLAGGLYRVQAFDAAVSTAADRTPLWELPLAVNGDPSESELEPLTREAFDERAGATKVVWVGQGEEISLTGGEARGQSYIWMLFVGAVLLFLITEFVILGWSWR